jgi:hypothetical protein
MLKKVSAGLLLILAACGGDSNGGGGGGGTDPCAATTIQEFYNALASKTLTAVDTNIENGDPATADTTFTHGDEYSATFSGSDVTLTIETDSEEADLVFDEDTDMFDVADHETNVLMVRDGNTILIQQNCTEDDDSFFISYYSEMGAPVEFFWRLDE